ncbi:MAG: hypothetical protein L0229_01200 [Blastocatellia bacterium]|nr:hypothetical protein [Blastocatellia bacterium]
MFKFTFKQKLQAVILVSIVTIVAYASVTGPEPRYTNAPGDLGNCVSCHDTFHEANVGSGSVTIDNVPAVYEPGEQYTLVVTVQQAGRQRFGFQLTAIDLDGNRIGTLEPINNSTQVNPLTGFGNRQYIQHSESGTFPTGQSSRTWQFRWKAPVDDEGVVRFYISGNAANGDGTNQNDHIYTTSTLAESPTTVVTVELLTDPEGQVLEPDTHFLIDWSATNISNVDSYELRYSTDDGATFPITNLIFSTTDPDVTEFDWTVPDKFSTNARIRVLAATQAGSAVEVLSGKFTINGSGATIPIITGGQVKGNKLFVFGDNFVNGSKVYMDDVPQKTKNGSGSATKLKVKKAGNNISPGQTVILVVHNPDGTVSEPFEFTRPL